jgi:hypothetical protein
MAIDTPPVGAGLDMVTEPTEGWPPTTEVGESDTPVRVGGLTVSNADADTLFKVAIMFEVRTAPTGSVLTTAVAKVDPAGILTED